MTNKKLGRKERFTTEKLSSIIDSYFTNNKVYGQVKATKIAEYAEKELGYEGIKYYHFNRNLDIKSIIDDANNLYEFNTTSDKQTFIPFNSDKFFDTYKNDPKSTKIVLRQFANRYEELNLNVLDLETFKLKYEAKIESLENENKKLKEKSSELRNTNKGLSENYTKLKKFKKFSDKVVMLAYLKGQGLVTSLDEENLKILLANCNLVTLNDSLVVHDTEPENQPDEDNDDTTVIQLDEYKDKDSENKNAVKNVMDILNNRLKR